MQKRVSSHGAPSFLGTPTQPCCASHTPWVQIPSRYEQSSGTPIWHTPLPQLPLPVQGSPSSQEVPSLPGAVVQPTLGSQTPTVQGPIEGQGMAEPVHAPPKQ
ncbi:MAG: hypothetical protein QM820_64435 [Minicystis sp.]